MFYPILCKVGAGMGGGCWKTRSTEGELFVDKVNKNALFNKFEFKLRNEKDGQERLNVVATTLESPYRYVWLRMGGSSDDLIVVLQAAGDPPQAGCGAGWSD